MAEKLVPKETVTFEEPPMSNVYTQEALINLLEEKGLIHKKELLEEIKRLKREQAPGKMKITSCNRDFKISPKMQHFIQKSILKMPKVKQFLTIIHIII